MITLHHVNLPTHDLAASEQFWREVVGLTDLAGGAADDMQRRLTQNVLVSTRFLSLGGSADENQLHLSDVDFHLNARLHHAVNPIAPAGHIALRTDDMAALRARLDKAGWPYSDYGSSQVTDWEQIFFMDPGGHVVEVHQTVLES
jgi:catechol 2,3-dioxygenase-like lactoylglutathione lyase family enzyme